jgi:hypothetical protein
MKLPFHAALASPPGAMITTCVLKVGIILLDHVTKLTSSIVVMRYNRDKFTHTLQMEAATDESVDQSEALRLSGSLIETFELMAEIDATNQLEFPWQNPTPDQRWCLRGTGEARIADRPLLFSFRKSLETETRISMPPPLLEITDLP